MRQRNRRHRLGEEGRQGSGRRAHFGRNGIFYTLDRSNGSYIQFAQYVSKRTWTKGLDPKTGLSVEYDPTKSLQTYAEGKIDRAGATATTCPNIQRGSNFFPSVYNPKLGIAYAPGSSVVPTFP